MTNKEIIEHLLSIKKWGILTDKDRQSLNLVIKELEDRPQGEWINFDDGSVACPICGTGTSIKSIPSVVFFRYCPYCGARLKGGAK